MTLEEAIKHAEEVAEENQAVVDYSDYYGENVQKCEKYAKEHRQLAKWLKELRELRILKEKGIDKLKSDSLPFDTSCPYALYCNPEDVEQIEDRLPNNIQLLPFSFIKKGRTYLVDRKTIEVFDVDYLQMESEEINVDYKENIPNR